MKLTKVILFFCLLCWGTKGLSQVTLRERNTQLEEVLKKIRSQTGYAFIFDADLVESATPITVTLKDASLDQALKAVFKDQSLMYKVVDKNIVLQRKKLPEVTSEKSPRSQKLVKGRVTDENNLPLPQILIHELTSQIKTTSDSKGEYSILVPDRGSLSFSGKGFNEQLVDYVDTTGAVNVQLQVQSIELNDVTVSLNIQKKNPSRFINMENRGYMNLSQVLQGTVPGLTLQVASINTKEVTSVEMFIQYLPGNVLFQKFVKMSVDEFYSQVGREQGQRIIDQLLSGKFVPENIRNNYRINTITKTSSTLVPQIRGANNYSASAAGMLVVIDGFPQDGFPADYPMVNVESIEVIKDPRELIKWGPKANSGLILIKTKAAKKGQVRVNYTANFYFQPAPKFNREKMRLASTSDYLDYVKDVDSVYAKDYNNSTLLLSPAARLFAQRRTNLISPADYTRTLDSLKGLDNESQIGMLQQDRFSQSHTVGLNGGSDIYKFNLVGTYAYEVPNQLKGYQRTVALNLNNEIHLLKNKLKINWLVNYTNDRSRTGYSFSPTSSLTEPYQMLVDAQGNYVYDYSSFSPTANALIQSKGYKNHGVNLLEDALVNKNLSRQVRKRTNMNLRWDLLPGLSWSSVVYYNGSSTKSNNVYGQESSYARQLVNNYGQYSTTGINFYAPSGDILQFSNRDADEFNVRSNLSYRKRIGQHQLTLSAGAGGASLRDGKPNSSTIYGYNNTTKMGSPVFLPTPNTNSGISNYNSLLPNPSYSPVYPFVLTVPIAGDTIVSRNLNANSFVNYKYSDRLSVSGSYNSVFNPLYGQSNKKYSSSSNYRGDVTGLILKKVGKILQNVLVSTGVEGVEMPDLPETYNNVRYQQVGFNNYAIYVNGLLPTQQKGQTSRNIYQRLTFTFLDSLISANVAYNTQKLKGNLSSLSTNPVELSNSKNSEASSRYISAGLTAQLRKGLLLFQINYSKSPEGEPQVNSSGSYDIAHEKYFRSNLINMLDIGFRIESISPYQGLGLMMSTNAATNGSFSQATNSSFTLLPPNNKNYEIYGKLAIKDNAYSLDVRYYNQTSSGLNNYSPSLTDPSTGVSSRRHIAALPIVVWNFF